MDESPEWGVELAASHTGSATAAPIGLSAVAPILGVVRLTLAENGDRRATELAAFGQRVRALREAAGLTQGQLAAATGMHRVQVNRIEQGRQDCGVSRVPGLAHALGVDPGDLFRGPSA